MSGRTNAHRAGFTVRCACGNTYHSDPSHVGKKLRCRCGRTVTIEAPPEAAGDSAREHGARRATRDGTRREGGKSPSSRRRLLPQLAIRQRLTSFATLSMHDFVHPRASRRWATRLARSTLALLVVSWALLAFWSDKMLPATLLAYGPRFVVFAPIVLVLPFVVFAARRAILPLLVASWIALFPIMGFRISLSTIGRAVPSAPAEGHVRALTFNVLFGNALASRLPEFLAEYSPDIVAFQECGPVLAEAMDRLDGWHSQRSGSLCTASRWPIAPAENAGTREARMIGGGYAEYDVDAPGGPIRVINLHLPTARYGLEGFMSSDEGIVARDPIGAIGQAARGASGVVAPEVDEAFRSNRLTREIASERAAVRARAAIGGGTVIVMGDFNMPVESRLYRDHWAVFDNAFEKKGNGFGYSKIEGRLIKIRIDHILVRGQTGIGNVTVGKAWYSDHRPVMADIAR